jgi:hypothetical protein
MPLYSKPFYIAVSPVGSKFAKAIQQKLQENVVNKVYRALPGRVAQKAARFGRQYFSVTQRVLNKVEQFHAFTRANVSCPAYALNVEEARRIDARTLFARTLINATNGRGIVEFESSAEHYPVAPLYTEYIPKKSEYRFHVFGGEVIDVQQKRKKQGFEGNRDTRIRNVNNGYVYCRDGITPPDGAAALAIAAVAACGYQYGAVDLIYNERRNQCYVLEVNSRPGLMGTTVEKYAEALVKMFNLKERE